MRPVTMLAIPAVCAMALAVAPVAVAQGDTSEGEAGSFSIDLAALNNSGVSGAAVLTLAEDGSLTVTIDAEGMVPEQPHAQHIHGDTNLNKDFVCPTASADADGDGIVNTTEGIPSYGDIHISLTTEGDASMESALAVDRFPVADAEGNLTYERTLPAAELPDGTATAVRNLHVVLHGIDVNGNGEYDFGAGPSELDPELPQEATAPAACGIIEGSNISSIPSGGVDTGVGPSSAHGEHGVSAESSSPLMVAGLVGLGALFVIGAGLRRRMRTSQR